MKHETVLLGGTNMSAPETAYPIGPVLYDSEGREVSRRKQANVVCTCSWRGKFGDLLGTNNEETLWCPQCKTTGWCFS